MNEQLRPSTLGEVLDRTVQLYRHNFWLFVGTAALPLMFIFALAIPLGLLFAVAGIAGALNSANSGFMVVAIIALVLAGIAALLVYFAIYVFSYAGITQATISLIRGEKPTFRATLASVKPRFWTYLGYMLLQGILIGVLPAFGACAFILPLVYLISRPGTDLPSRIALGFLIGLVAAVAFVAILWLALSYSMGMAVCVTEKKGHGSRWFGRGI